MSRTRTRADLFREYARVIEMCEGTGVDPLTCVRLTCVRINGVLARESYWSFDEPPEKYTFAAAIVEDRPVFESDELYDRTSGTKYRVTADGHVCAVSEGYADGEGCKYAIDPSMLSWNPPKPKTVTFKMEARPAPISIAGYAKSKLKEGDRDKYDLVLTFDSIEARDTWKRALEYACHEGSN